MLDNDKKTKNDNQNIPPEEVIAHGIMQLDGTYRYKGQIFDENGNPWNAQRDKETSAIKQIIEKPKKTQEKEENTVQKVNLPSKNNIPAQPNPKPHPETKLKLKNPSKNNISAQPNPKPHPETKLKLKKSVKKEIQKDIEQSIIPSLKEKPKTSDIFTEYPREKIISLEKQLPQEVRDVLTSNKEVDDVENICERYGVANKFLEIQKMILYVALGLRSMNDFKKYIETSVAKNKEDAGKIYREIFRFVFFPIKDLIGVTYETEKEVREVEKMGKQPTIKIKSKNEGEAKPIIKDRYREPIE